MTTNSDSGTTTATSTTGYQFGVIDRGLLERAVRALLGYCEKQASDTSLLGDETDIKVQIGILECVSKNPSLKPIRLDLPHPLHRVVRESLSSGMDVDNDEDDRNNEHLSEASVCLIVKDDNTKAMVNELRNSDKAIVADSLKCLQKIITLSSLRKKYPSFEQRRELLQRHDLFLVDDRIQLLMRRALGKVFLAKKKNPVPIRLTRGKSGLPFVVQKCLRGTYMFAPAGRCVMVRAANTAMTATQIVDNCNAAASNAVKRLPRKWHNVVQISIKTNESVSLPLYLMTPQQIKAARSTLRTKGGDKEKNEPSSNKRSLDDDDDDESKKKTKKPKKPAMVSPLLEALQKTKDQERNNKKRKNSDTNDDSPTKTKTVKLLQDSSSKEKAKHNKDDTTMTTTKKKETLQLEAAQKTTTKDVVPPTTPLKDKEATDVVGSSSSKKKKKNKKKKGKEEEPTPTASATDKKNNDEPVTTPNKKNQKNDKKQPTPKQEDAAGEKSPTTPTTPLSSGKKKKDKKKQKKTVTPQKDKDVVKKDESSSSLSSPAAVEKNQETPSSSAKKNKKEKKNKKNPKNDDEPTTSHRKDQVAASVSSKVTTTPKETNVGSPKKTSTQPTPTFLPSPKFTAKKEGYVFRKGTRGTGYYEDKVPVPDASLKNLTKRRSVSGGGNNNNNNRRRKSTSKSPKRKWK